MNNLFAFLAAGAAALVLAVSANAQSMEEAVEAWLADDDATALPILSELANAGNRDAQYFLGQLDRVTPPGSDTPFVLGLSRAERRDLLRAPSGLSGTGWTVVLEEDEGDPLAAAMNAARLPDATIDVAQTLWNAGEEEAAQRLVFEIFDRARFDEIFALPADDPMLQGLDMVAWMRSYLSNPPGPNQWRWLEESEPAARGSGLMMMSFIAPVLAPQLRPGRDLRRFTLAMRGAPNELFENAQLTQAASVLLSQLDNDPNMATVAAFCDANCGDQRGLCALEVITRVGGYDRLTRHDTPYEGALSQERFQGSPRAVNGLVRWMAAARQDLSGGRTISQCVADIVNEAQTAG
ncbi:MAG: hypothetical protein ACPGID_01725 [Rubricella sp.]